MPLERQAVEWTARKARHLYRECVRCPTTECLIKCGTKCAACYACLACLDSEIPKKLVCYTTHGLSDVVQTTYPLDALHSDQRSKKVAKGVIISVLSQLATIGFMSKCNLDDSTDAERQLIFSGCNYCATEILEVFTKDSIPKDIMDSCLDCLGM